MKYLFVLLFIYSAFEVKAQEMTQKIRGVVTDQSSKEPLFGVNIYVENSNPPQGAVSDMDGNFSINNVALGRVSLVVSSMGYNTVRIPDIVVSSAKEVVLNIEIEEMVKKLDEVVIKAKQTEGESINKMATLSVQSFSMEQAGRYAGGMDDPARMASSYAGVASGLGSNAIVVRGNAPKGLLWRLEGVEITNPSHFADMVAFGGGGVSSLSGMVLSTTDFFTGAFPAEYGNAVSGVFDLRMRSGNNEQHEHAFQIGTNGLEFASEGPFCKSKKSSYLFNYRYSTLALLSPILPPEAGKISYQDLSFKNNFILNNAGILSFWGLASIDHQLKKAFNDSLDWESDIDRKRNDYSTAMTAFGLSHKITVSKKAYLSSTLAFTGTTIQLKEDSLNNLLSLLPSQKVAYNTANFVFSQFYNHKFNARHTNKTGFVVTQKNYDIEMKKINADNNQLVEFSNENGQTYLLQAFTQSQFKPVQNVILNIGLHSQWFLLNDNYSIEPRAGIRWNFNEKQSISLAYGLHSRLEMLNYYLSKKTIASGAIVQPNKNMDFSKSHHFVMSYNYMFNNNLSLKIEPYYQYLYDIPVIDHSYFSLINLESDWFFNDSLINKGKATNIGVDFTLEKYLSKGWYGLSTLSLFDSKYKGGDNTWRDTRFDKGYVVNVLLGKEWNTGRQKEDLISFNGKISCFGGDRLHPVNEEATMANKELVYDYLNAFEEKKPDSQIISFSINYRNNKEKYSGVWSLQIINILGQKEFEGYTYNRQTNQIDKEQDPFIIPSLSYRIEF